MSNKTPRPQNPALPITQPPKGANQLTQTHILDTGIWQPVIPLVLHLLDLRTVYGSMYRHNGSYGLLFLDVFDHVASLKVHGDTVAVSCYLVAETLNL